MEPYNEFDISPSSRVSVLVPGMLKLDRGGISNELKGQAVDMIRSTNAVENRSISLAKHLDILPTL